MFLTHLTRTQLHLSNLNRPLPYPGAFCLLEGPKPAPYTDNRAISTHGSHHDPPEVHDASWAPKSFSEASKWNRHYWSEHELEFNGRHRFLTETRCSLRHPLGYLCSTCTTLHCEWCGVDENTRPTRSIGYRMSLRIFK